MPWARGQIIPTVKNVGVHSGIKISWEPLQRYKPQWTDFVIIVLHSQFGQTSAHRDRIWLL